MSKTKTKMKSGTIAVIALSIVLVLSLITTITLAYFTASRNVITTIQFASGVKLQMAGAYRTTAGEGGSPAVGTEDTPPSIGPETLYWKAAYGAKAGAQGSTAVPTSGTGAQLNEATGTYTEISEKLFFEDLKVRVLDLDAYVAVRVAVTGTVTTGGAVVDMSGTGQTELGASYVQPMMASVWMEYTGSTTTSGTYNYGWFVYKGSNNAATKVTKSSDTSATPSPRDSTTGFVDIINDWTIEADNNLAGKTLVFKIVVYASNTLEGLAEQIDNYNNTATTGPVATEQSGNKTGYAKEFETQTEP